MVYGCSVFFNLTQLPSMEISVFSVLLVRVRLKCSKEALRYNDLTEIEIISLTCHFRIHVPRPGWELWVGDSVFLPFGIEVPSSSFLYLEGSSSQKGSYPRRVSIAGELARNTNFWVLPRPADSEAAERDAVICILTSSLGIRLRLRTADQISLCCIAGGEGWVCSEEVSHCLPVLVQKWHTSLHSYAILVKSWSHGNV